jgi:type I restriction enzyme, S subunit
MKIRTIPSGWLEIEEYRLNAKPYFSGAIEATIALERLFCENLVDLTERGKKGIFNGPRFTRVYVNEPSLGLKLLSGADMLQSDLSYVDMIAKWKACSMPEMVLKLGTTLISSYGTIGRCVYTRPDMVGHIGSDNVLKIIPDISKIRPGYLYSFLSGKFGVPQVIKGEGGSVVTYLDPSRVYSIPVPRLGDVEEQSHDLIQQAANLRTKANSLLTDATKDLELEIGGGPVEWQHKHVQAFAIKATTFNSKISRLDAFHHIGFVGEAMQKAKVPLIQVRKYARALRPPIMKRIRVEEGGYEFLGGSELVMLDQRSQTRISARTPNIDKFIVHAGYILFQCVGQRYGLFGRPILANRMLIGKAVTEAVMRLIPHDTRDAGYISVYLATGFGQRLGMRHSAGTSIPVLQEEGARKILIYWPEEGRRHAISRIAEKAWEYRAQATELEDEARSFVEQAIEQGGR